MKLLPSNRAATADARWLLAVAVLAAVAAVYPLFGSSYGLTVVRDGLILGIFALSLDFLWGRAGLPSFGHAAFFGLGGYLYALATLHLAPSYASVLGLVGAVGGGVVAGLFLGLFLLPAGVRGALFLIATVALTQISQQVALSWSSVTGADGGLIGIPPPGIKTAAGTIALRHPTSQYYFVLVLAVGILLGVWLVCRSRYGRILTAIASNEFRAQTLGVNTSKQLTIALAISSGIAALAGALYTAMTGIMVPDLIGPLLSIEVVVWVLIGGRGTLLGPFLGTFVVWRLSQEISSYDPRLWPLFIGAFFLIMVFVFPNGVISIVKRVREASSRRGMALKRPPA